jgi:cephalosporin-C deacetylase
MPIYDLTTDELTALRGEPRQEPADFDEFWADTLARVRRHPLGAVFTAVDSGLTTIRTYDVSFAGWDGQTVRGWLLRPARDQDAHGAGVVEFVGYGGGRGHPHEWLTWPSAGYTYLVVDARGQGSGYRTGVTPDTDPNSDPQVPGFLTRGIRSPGGYYYRRVYADAVRAVEALRVAPDVDPRFVAVAGTSQGGGLAIAAAALADDVWGLITAVPFLCDFRRGAELAPEGPFTELAAYCAQRPEEIERVFSTLSYFDAVNLARRCTAPALWTVALMDRVIPPSTVLAAHAAYRGDAQLDVHPFAGHEDARGHQAREALRFLHKLRTNDQDLREDSP